MLQKCKLASLSSTSLTKVNEQHLIFPMILTADYFCINFFIWVWFLSADARIGMEFFDSISANSTVTWRDGVQIFYKNNKMVSISFLDCVSIKGLGISGASLFSISLCKIKVRCLIFQRQSLHCEFILISLGFIGFIGSNITIQIWVRVENQN